MPVSRRYIVKSLTMITLKVVMKRLQQWERFPMWYSSEDLLLIIKHFHAYCKPVIPHMIEYKSYQNFAEICVLFLPEFIKKNKLHLNTRYASRIVDIIVDSELFHSDALRTVSELVIERDFSYRRKELFSKFPNLKKLQIQFGLTDETLKSIADYFPELTVLSGVQDPDIDITDRGLQHLARLRKLKCLLMNPDAEVGNVTEFSVKGFALLLTRLPLLEKVAFPGDIMFEAFDDLQISNSRLLSLRSLDFGKAYLHIDTLISVNTVCPNLERLGIMVINRERDLNNEYFFNFTRLKELRDHDTLDFWINRSIFQIQTLCSQLVVLHINEFSRLFADVFLVGTTCVNLKFLSLAGVSQGGTPTLQDCVNQIRPVLFPRLQVFEFRWGELRDFYFMMHQNSGLVKAAITIDIQSIDVWMDLRPRYGFWRKLETLSITLDNENDEIFYNEAVVHHLVEVFPSLKRIFASIAKEEEGVILISSRGNDVLLCSNDSFNLFSKDPEFDYLDCLE